MEMQGVHQRRNAESGSDNQPAGSSPVNNNSQPPARENKRAATAVRQKESIIVRAIRKMKLVGLRQALKPGTSLTERICWIGVFFICVYFTVHLAVLSVEDYEKNRTSLSVENDVKINDVPFPALTVTATKTFRKSGIDEVLDMYTQSFFEVFIHPWTEVAVNKLLFAVDHVCEMVSSFASRFQFFREEETLNLKKKKQWVISHNTTLRDDPNDAVMTDLVMPFLRNNMIDCKSILLACMWEGNKTECDNLFSPVMTDIGMGCSFNRIPDDLLRTSTGLMSLLHNRTNISPEEVASWETYNIEMDLRNAVERLRKRSPKQFPRSQNSAGTMKGISFLLLHDVVQNFSCPATSSNGFLVAVHSPFEEPQMKNGIGIPPGHEVFITITGEVTIADKELEDLPINERNCTFQKDSKLNIFKRYSLSNCRRECLARRIASECKCHQLSMSSGHNETICGPLHLDCVEKTTRNLDVDAGMISSVKSFEEVTSIVHATWEYDTIPAKSLKVVVIFAFLFGVIGGILGMTLEFSVGTLFNIFAGMTVLVAWGFRRVKKRYFTAGDKTVETPTTTPNASNENVPPDREAHNYQESLDRRNDNESDEDSSSDPEDSSGPEDAANENHGGQPINKKKTLLKGIRKTLVKDLKKLLKKDLEETQVKEIKEAILTEVKELIATDINTNQSRFIALEEQMRKIREENNSNQRELGDKISKDMKDMRETLATDLKEMLLVLVKNQNTWSTVENKPENIAEPDEDENSQVAPEDDTSCQSDSVEITDVQEISQQETSSPTCTNRFKKASKLAVLFVRSGVITNKNTTCDDNDDSSDDDDGTIELGVGTNNTEPTSPRTPQTQLSAPNTQEHRPSSSVPLNEDNDFDSDDDFFETLILP